MLSNTLAQQIAGETTEAIGYNVIITDAEGMVIGSGDTSRVGSFHEASIEAMRTRESAWHNPEEARALRGVRPGITLPLVIGDEAVGTVGITGSPHQVRRFGVVVRRQTEILLQESEMLRSTTAARASARAVSSQRSRQFDPDRGRGRARGVQRRRARLPAAAAALCVVVRCRRRCHGTRAAARAPLGLPPARGHRRAALGRSVRDSGPGRHPQCPERRVGGSSCDQDGPRGAEPALQGGHQPASRHGREASRLLQRRSRGAVARSPSAACGARCGSPICARSRRWPPSGTVVRGRLVEQELGGLRSAADWLQLRATVVHWCESGFNQVAAAKALNIHRNTLLYRLDKIERLLWPVMA